MLYQSKETKIRVKFKHLGGGLKTFDGGPPRGFAIAGADHKFHWAEARIDGNGVVLWSNDVPQTCGCSLRLG